MRAQPLIARHAGRTMLGTHRTSQAIQENMSTVRHLVAQCRAGAGVVRAAHGAGRHPGFHPGRSHRRVRGRRCPAPRSPSRTSTPGSSQNGRLRRGAATSKSSRCRSAAYSVTVSMPGFKTWQLERVDAHRRRSPPRRRRCSKSAPITEQVSVEGGAPLLQTERSSVQTVIQMQQIRELPLSTRNPVALVNLVPGMRFTGVERPRARLHGAGLRPARQSDRVPAGRPERERGDGRRRHHHPERRHDRGVQRRDLQLQRRERPQSAAGDHGHQVGHQRLQRHVLGVLPERQAERAEHLLRGRPAEAATAISSAARSAARSSATARSSSPASRARRSQRADLQLGRAHRRDAAGRLLGACPRDPRSAHRTAVPRQHHPADRISSASRFFLPYVLQPNAPDGRFRAVAPIDRTTRISTRRASIISSRSGQRIYGRWVMNDNENDRPATRPIRVGERDHAAQHRRQLHQHPDADDAADRDGGYLKSDNRFTSPVVGTDRTCWSRPASGASARPGREDFVGPAQRQHHRLSPASTRAFGVQRPAVERRVNAKASLTWVRGTHSLSAGYEFNDRSVYGAPRLALAARQLRLQRPVHGDGFADFLLGLTSGTRRNFPLETFGLDSSPYSGLYPPGLLEGALESDARLGLRFECWHEK